ncbi:unnamed protein product [Psylliodes chrysocephalus]|uniref:Uncharacterized protein n=1 Tax=Psylliodes chrysocephalus TaxID=3402493 RepID=A0A9P0GC55_9CUCU|nr:unnamed protein product [Psylliodes chrysocephala]
MNSSTYILQFFVFLSIYIVTNGELATNTINRSNFNLETAQTPYQLIETLRKQVLDKENELKKAEEINKNFEKMIQLVNILGQVDSFLTDRTKTIIKKIAMLTDADDGAFEKEFRRNHNINK